MIVHFGMEISLLAARIRPATDLVTVLIFNTLIEFNSGTPFLFIIWTLTKNRKIPIGGETEELIFETVGKQHTEIISFDAEEN